MSSGSRVESLEIQEPTSPSSNIEDAMNHSQRASRNRLSTAQLSVLVFYTVSGGPFGVEESVRSGGSCLALFGFISMFCCWSIPEAWMTAELGAAIPCASGSVAWVEKAWGPFAAWMTGYLSWISGVTDNALYPALFLAYVEQAMSVEGPKRDTIFNPWLRFTFQAGFVCILAFINWIGLRAVGDVSLVSCALTMSPFAVLSLVGMTQCQPSRWFELPSAGVLKGVRWRPLLNNLFWNLNSFDSVASFSTDVETHQIYVHSICLGLVLIFAGYVFPLAIVLGATDASQDDWVDGYFVKVASEIAGPWLGRWLVVASAVSNVSLFQAEFSTDILQMQGMAERGYIPKIFALKNEQGTPTYSILIGALLVLLIGSFARLEELIEALNFCYGIELLIEYSSFFKIRLSDGIAMPWKLPIETRTCILLFTPTISLTLAVMLLASYKTLIFGVLSTALGFVLYLIKEQPCRPLRQSYQTVETGGVT